MVLEARLSEGVEEVSLWVDLTEVVEEEQKQLSDPAWVEVVVQNCQHLYGTLSLSLAVDYEDAVCTKTAVYPAKETARLLSSVPVSCYLHGRRSLEVSLGRIQVKEEPVDSRGVGIQAEAAAAGDPGEDPAPSWAGMAPSAMVFPSTHSSVRHCTSSGGWRGSTRTGAASGAASVAAAAAGGVAHVDWRTSSRPARPRNRRSSVPGRRRTICGA